MIIDFEVTPVYRRLDKHLVDKNYKYICARGGTRSSKSYSILQLLFMYALKHKDKIINIITESMVKSKRTLIPDMKIISAPFNNYVDFAKSESTFYFVSGTIIRFISAEDVTKIDGMKSDILYGDEVDGINFDVFDGLSFRTKEKVFVSFNPRGKFEWYEKMASHPLFIEDISTYLDNPFLEESIIKDLLIRAEKNINFKRVYLLGEWGNADGLVFKEEKNWFIIDELPEVFDKEGFGIDYGYTNDPSVLLKIVSIGDSIYIDECFYEKRMLNREIAKEIKDYNPHNNKVISENSSPSIIAELKKIYGINIQAVDKPEILNSLNRLLEHNIFITSGSINTIQEFRNYQYHKKKKDPKGRALPIDDFNHAIDALRYWFVMNFKISGSELKLY